MTFDEWCKQISKEMEYEVPKRLVNDILICGIRVALEELLTNPDKANLSIQGIMKFRLTKQLVNTVITKTPKTVYALRMTVSQPLKDVYNGRRDYRTLLIGGTLPLYPEFIIKEDGTKVMGRGTRRTKIKNYNNTYKIKTDSSYKKEWYKAQREALKASLPLDEDE